MNKFLQGFPLDFLGYTHAKQPTHNREEIIHFKFNIRKWVKLTVINKIIMLKLFLKYNFVRNVQNEFAEAQL